MPPRRRRQGHPGRQAAAAAQRAEDLLERRALEGVLASLVGSGVSPGLSLMASTVRAVRRRWPKVVA